KHQPGAASRRSLRACASSGAFQCPLQRLTSLLQGGPLFRGQTTGETDPICEDGGNRSRADIHSELTHLVITALGQTLKDGSEQNHAHSGVR
ncbi:hypothetical protein C7I85_14885, partial [Mesorhizobium soli]